MGPKKWEKAAIGAVFLLATAWCKWVSLNLIDLQQDVAVIKQAVSGRFNTAYSEKIIDNAR